MAPRELVDRRQELNELRSLLRSLAGEQAVRFPIRAIVGPGAIGKSTLVRAICDECVDWGLPVAYLDCTKLELTDDSLIGTWSFVERVVAELAATMPDQKGERFRTRVGQPDVDLASGGTRSLEEQTLADAIDRALVHIEALHCVIAVDGAERVPPRSLQLLGERFFFPVSDSGRTLILVASRTTLDWGSPRYKLSRRTRTLALDALSAEDTVAQIAESQFADLGREIFGITGGHPGGNDVVVRLLQDLQSVENRAINRARFSDYEARLVEAVVDEVVREDVGIPPSLFQSFYVLSCLRSFDVDIPGPFLTLIDASRDWSVALAGYGLLREVTEGAPELVRFVHGRNAYVMRPFLRRALSLHMRIFRRAEYLTLAQAAFDYYTRRLAAEPSNPYLLLDKLYHFADLTHTSEGLYGAGLTARVQRIFRQELLSLFSGFPLENRLIGENPSRRPQRTYDERLRDLQHLRSVLKDDIELAELIGDTEALLLEVVDSAQSELLQSDRAIFEVQRRVARGKTEQEYSLTLVTELGNIHVTLDNVVPVARRSALLHDLDVCQSLDELETLGRTLRNMFLPVRLQELLASHTGPLLLSVNDMEVPWELIHDGEEFLGLRLAVGTRVRTADLVKMGPYSRSTAVRPLLVGVPVTEVEGLPPLPLVEEEVRELANLFSGSENISFRPSEDVLLGEEATSYDFLKKLSSGRYDIVHFAGHALYDPEEMIGGLALADSLISLSDIQRNVESRPLVFLNACRSSAATGVQLRPEYLGSHALGLATAFILGGAAACVGNLWRLPDENARAFPQGFYVELLSGAIQGEALRRAKAQARTRYPAEMWWTSYSLFGDPSGRLRLG